ncbi:MAG: DUF6055 domain-containing protein [Actinomycetota bacterium]|nr:DUF6055 domain-containing protein [Actinomycetota bacterium]
MKRSVVLLVLLGLAATGASLPAASASGRGSSLTRGLDLSLDGPLRIPDEGAELTEDTAALSSITNDTLSRALRAGRISPARFALERAEATFAGDFDGHLSLVLTDLALRVRELDGADRERALAILARPTDPDTDTNIDHVSYRNNPVNAACSAHFCVHWTDSGRHAVSSADSDADQTPDYVEQVQVEMENVWSVLVDDLDFKAPKSDITSDNTVTGLDAAKLDVYLVDSGRDGVYGFCTTDDPNLIDPSSNYSYFDGSAYCALDDDFDPAQFLGAPAGESLQVTAAHEFFHAVQLAYAAGHDTWMSEGTAALMEDVVHDDVDDNYQYLQVSPLRQPHSPIDFSNSPHHYGAWLYWRFLTELDETGGVPIIREVWENAAVDGLGGPGLVSTFAMKRALADHDMSFPDAKAFFSLVNYVPEAFYEEGAGYLAAVGRRPPLMGTFTLGTAKKSTGLRVAQLDHLTAGYVAFKPGTGVSKLRINVDLPARATDPRAQVLILTKDRQAQRHSIGVNSTGVGGLRGIPFKKSEIRMVVLVLDNASTRFKSCFRRNTPWTCSGVPVDDGLRFRLSGTAR